MSQSLAPIYIHLVFHVASSSPFVRREEEERLHLYLRPLLESLDCSPIAIGGMPDHLHLLFRLSKNKAISEVVREVKSSSGRWLKQLDPYYASFAWQAGYGAFSVSASVLEATRCYVVQQKQHHERRTTVEELKRLLELYGETYDLRYLLQD